MGESLKLLADGMLGRLARWLRLLGYDTAYDNVADDLALARQARAEGRVLLTRDRELAARRGLRTLLIHSETLEEQLQEVRQALGPSPYPPLSRCTVCNVELSLVSPEDVAERVPPYVLRTQSRFLECPRCGRVYWAGSHARKIKEMLRRLGSDG